MRITKNNYFAQIANLDISAIDSELQQGHELIKEATDNGKDWSIMEDDDIAETFEMQFKLIGILLEKLNKTSASAKKPSSTRKVSKKAMEPKLSKNLVNKDAEQITEFDDQYKFIRRFLGMDGKGKTKYQLGLFIKAIQRSITQRRIIKKSTYAAEIIEIQKKLIRLYEVIKESELKQVKLTRTEADRYRSILGKHQEMLSVKLVKSYINLQGKLVTRKRIINLHNRITRAMNNNDLDKKDVFYSRLMKAIGRLKAFIEQEKKETTIFNIEEAQLSGIQAALDGLSSDLGCVPCQKKVQKKTMMTGKEIIQLRFDRLGFKGKYHDLIGDPARGFSLMISAPPKYGKSFLAIDFAGYLVQNHGKTLFVASEEGIDATLQEKILSTRYLHNDNFIVAESIPSDLSDYDFVFIDSVNDLRLTPEDVKSLAHDFPNVSWILIFQNRKDGGYKGSAEFRHLVDSVIEFPERGLAIQYGRFNQGGELRTFKP